MSSIIDRLVYEDIYKELLNLHGLTETRCKTNKNKDTHDIEIRARFDHAQNVLDSLLCIIKSICITDSFNNENAKSFIKYGFFRRINLLHLSYETVIRISPCDRTEPFSIEETRLLSRDINSIYLHLRGALDNLSWALMHEKAPDYLKNNKKETLSIFNTKFRTSLSTNANLKEIQDNHNIWYKTLKEKRDPAAHRIPLYIPPALIHENTQTYETYLYFVHDTNEPHTPIYPTIPTDIAHLVKIFHSIKKLIMAWN